MKWLHWIRSLWTPREVAPVAPGASVWQAYIDLMDSLSRDRAQAEKALWEHRVRQANLENAAADYFAAVECMLRNEHSGGDGWWAGWELAKLAHDKAKGNATSTRTPVVSLGQGEYRRDIHASDIKT